MSGDDDVPTPIDFHDPAQARAWEADTIQRRPWRPQFFAAFAAALNEIFQQVFTVLELGSGPGHLAEHILQHCPVGAYTALDFSAAMHALARERLASFLDRITFAQRDFRLADWGAGLGPFDAVVTMQAAHELRHKRHLPALLARTAPLLRTGGVFLYCDHYAQEGSGKHPDLYLAQQDQPSALQAAGFGDVATLLDAGGMALYGARLNL